MKWLRKLGEWEFTRLLLIMVTYIGAASAVLLLAGGLMAEIIGVDMFTTIEDMTVEPLLIPLLGIYVVLRVLEMLFEWIEHALKTHFSDERRVELRVSDIELIIAALETHPDAEKKRVQSMIGHLIYYAQ